MNLKKGLVTTLAFASLTTYLFVTSTAAPGAEWKKNDKGWWYEEADGSYPTNAWKLIKDKWYYFDNVGYMVENRWVGNYYLGADGAMLVSTSTPDGYYVGSDGTWISDGSSSSTKNISTSNIHIIRAVEFAKDLDNAPPKTALYVLGSSLNGAARIDEMLWVAHTYNDSRLSESGEYFVMNVDNAKEMIRQIFGSVTSKDVSAMDIYGSNMYYNSVAFRGDAGPHIFSNPSSATIEGSEVKIVGTITDYSYNPIGTYTVTLTKTNGGYFGGYSFYSLSTSYN